MCAAKMCKAAPSVLILLTIAFLAAHGQIISDGSFEDPVLSSGQALSFGTGSSIGGVWTVLGTPGNGNAVVLIQTSYSEPSNGVNQFNAEDGLNSLDLTGIANQGTMSGVEQMIPTTMGQSYLLSFWVGRASGNNSFYATASTMDLSIDGGPRVSFTNSNSTPGEVNWQQFTTTFVATGTSTTLDFLNGQTTNNFTGLDNVVVSIVPEPNVAELTGIGLFSVLVCLSFRRIISFN
jgi:Protein of unknown function (DUF642)